jgi:hypothetical protein
MRPSLRLEILAKILLTFGLLTFVGCGRTITITAPTDGTQIALNGASQQAFNVSDSINDFSNTQVTIYSVNTSITGTCTVGSNYAQCAIVRNPNGTGASCSTYSPCDALLTVAQSSGQRDRILLKVSF